MNRRLVFGALVASSTLFACSAVLGFDTFSLDPGTTPGSEGGTDSGLDVAITIGADGDTCDPSMFMTSSTSCGRCFHDCLGGECHMGVCQAKLVGDALASPEGLAVTEQFIFVADYGSKRILQFDRVSKGDCGRGCEFVKAGDGADNPTGMGTDGTNVYWATLASDTDAPSIKSCPVTGCDPHPVVLQSFGEDVFVNGKVPTDLLPLQLVVFQGQVFWGQNYNGMIQSVTTDGSNAVTTYLAKNDLYAPVDLQVDANNIYFTVNGLAGQSAQIFGVPRTPVAKAFQIAQSAAIPYGISLSPSQQLYWSMNRIDTEDYSDGAIESVPASQTGTSDGVGFSSNQQNARMVVSDGLNVYWLVGGQFDHNTGSVVYCPVTGCTGAPMVLANAQDSPRHLTQDAKAIYWTNEGLGLGNDGQVWLVAKP